MKTILKILISLSVFFLIVACCKNIFKKERKIVIAHRGAPGYLPEHTLASKAFAYALGADYLEQDLVLTKDNVPIVLHDIYIDTVSNVEEIFPEKKRDDGRYYAIDFTFKEIKQLKATERKQVNSNEAVFKNRFPLNKSYFLIPSLEEEIELVQGLNKTTKRNVGIYPEIKAPEWHKRQGRDISKIVLEILSKYGYNTKDDNIYLQTFDYKELIRIREELGYKGKLIMLIDDPGSLESDSDYAFLQSEDGLREIAKFADGIGPHISHIVKEIPHKKTYEITPLVKLAHKYNLAVHAYTFREEDLESKYNNIGNIEWILFNKAGIDGLFTDQTDITLRN